MIAVPFLLNTVANFIVGLLIAKFLGPAEYGRYAIAISIAAMLQSIGFDWTRLSAVRFGSTETGAERPRIETTIAALFAGAGGLALLAAAIVKLTGVEIWVSPALLALAIVVGTVGRFSARSAATCSARSLRIGFEASMVRAKRALPSVYSWPQ